MVGMQLSAADLTTITSTRVCKSMAIISANSQVRHSCVTHTCMHARTRVHAHTHAHTNTHTHTHRSSVYLTLTLHSPGPHAHRTPPPIVQEGEKFQVVDQGWREVMEAAAANPGALAAGEDQERLTRLQENNRWVALDQLVHTAARTVVVNDMLGGCAWMHRAFFGVS